MRGATSRAVALILVLAVTGACRTRSASETLQQEPDEAERRERETRVFDTTDEQALLRAALILLQDDGFQLDEMDATLGVVRGSCVLGWKHTTALVVTRPAGDPPRATELRISYRQPGYTMTGVTHDTMDDPVVYQRFFERLSRAVFLEARAP